MCVFLFSNGLLINGLHTAPEPPQQLHSSQPIWRYPHSSLTLKMTPPTHHLSPLPQCPLFLQNPAPALVWTPASQFNPEPPAPVFSLFPPPLLPQVAAKLRAPYPPLLTPIRSDWQQYVQNNPSLLHSGDIPNSEPRGLVGCRGSWLCHFPGASCLLTHTDVVRDPCKHKTYSQQKSALE